MLGPFRQEDAVDPSPTIIAFIKGFEQCRLHAYMPTPNDKPTIGWGTTGSDIVMGLSWSQEQCDDRFAADLSRFAQGVSRLLTGATSQNQFDGMLSLAYNIGLGNFGPSTLLRLHNSGDFGGVPAEFLRWNHQAGQVLPGLTRRRQGEADIYRGA
jgi:GH24 family phage-related lysozyme (muramidase)